MDLKPVVVAALMCLTFSTALFNARNPVEIDFEKFNSTYGDIWDPNVLNHKAEPKWVNSGASIHQSVLDSVMSYWKSENTEGRSTPDDISNTKENLTSNAGCQNATCECKSYTDSFCYIDKFVRNVKSYFSHDEKKHVDDTILGQSQDEDDERGEQTPSKDENDERGEQTPIKDDKTGGIDGEGVEGKKGEDGKEDEPEAADKDDSDKSDVGKEQEKDRKDVDNGTTRKQDDGKEDNDEQDDGKQDDANEQKDDVKEEGDDGAVRGVDGNLLPIVWGKDAIRIHIRSLPKSMSGLYMFTWQTTV